MQLPGSGLAAPHPPSLTPRVEVDVQREQETSPSPSPPLFFAVNPLGLGWDALPWL